MKHRIAVLGLHHDHVWTHLEEIAAIPDAEIVAVADHHPGLLQQFQEKYQAPVYEDYFQLLEREEITAAYLFASNKLSEDLAVAVCDRGIHCLVEKPMASTLNGANRMLAAAEQAGVRLMINWPFAWLPQLRHGIAMARAGEIGEIWQVRYRAAHEGPTEIGCSSYFTEWLYDPGLNGAGALMDYCCYGAVLAEVLLGRPVQVSGSRFSTGRKTGLPAEDNAVLLMHYPRALAIAEASWTQVGEMTSYIATIYGSEGTLLVEPGRYGRILLATREQPEGVALSIPPQPEHLSHATSHFLTLIDHPEMEPHPLCDPRAGRGANWILEAGLIATE